MDDAPSGRVTSAHTNGSPSTGSPDWVSAAPQSHGRPRLAGVLVDVGPQRDARVGVHHQAVRQPSALRCALDRAALRPVGWLVCCGHGERPLELERPPLRRPVAAAADPAAQDRQVGVVAVVRRRLGARPADREDRVPGAGLVEAVRPQLGRQREAVVGHAGRRSRSASRAPCCARHGSISSPFGVCSRKSTASGRGRQQHHLDAGVRVGELERDRGAPRRGTARRRGRGRPRRC